MHVLLTWNPKAWTWSSLHADAVSSRSPGGFVDRWSCGNTKNIPVGTRVFLMRLGADPKGLIASGTVTAAPYEDTHWDDAKRAQGLTALFVKVVFDHIVDGEPPISLIELEDIAPDVTWTPQASGNRIPTDVAQEIERRWAQKTQLGSAALPDEVTEPFVEGAAQQIWVSRIERNPLARRRCIEHHGAKCAACGLSLEATYGPLAAGYIHVHHLTPLASATGVREIDPVHDLRPLCPNCHSVAHLRNPPYSMEEIAAMLASARNGA